MFSIYRHTAVQSREVVNKPVRPEDVTFYMFSKENPIDYITLKADNMNLLAQKNRKIVFFIHGWINSRNIEWYGKLKDAFMKTYKDEYVVVQVDWELPAKDFYYVSAINTYDVGEFSICNFYSLNNLIKFYRLQSTRHNVFISLCIYFWVVRSYSVYLILNFAF